MLLHDRIWTDPTEPKLGSGLGFKIYNLEPTSLEPRPAGSSPGPSDRV